MRTIDFIFSLMFFLFTLFFLAPAVLSVDIEITYPTPGSFDPAGSTYQEYQGGKAHFLTPKITINQEVIDTYEFYDNNNLIGTFQASDTEPTTAVITEPGLHTLAVKGLKDGQIIEEDSVEVDFVFEYFDVVDSINEEDPVELPAAGVTNSDLEEIGATEEEYQETMKHVQIKKELIHITVKDKFTGEEKENTMIIVKASADNQVQELKIYELIPKNIAEHVNDVILTGDYTIINPDPLIVWTFAGVETSEIKNFEATYAVEDFVLEEDLEEIKTIPIAQIKPPKKYLYYLIPIILVPLIVILFVYFNRFQKEE